MRDLSCQPALPAGFELVGFDEMTGKSVGWIPVGLGPEDRWHREAFVLDGDLSDGTYELLGPKIQGNKDGYSEHTLVSHARAASLSDAPRDFYDLKVWLADHNMEGIVWRHEDGRMAKIKRRDFGLKW